MAIGTISIGAFLSFTLAILLLFIGKTLLHRYEVLRRYSIPEAVVGGVLCAGVVSALYFTVGIQVVFDLEVRQILLLYFFAGVGLSSDIATVRKGGRPLVILTALAALFMVLQNITGMGVASLFGLDPVAGLMTGSVSLVGGAGTTLAWAPHFVEQLGIDNAMELGMASNMVGLIAACTIGGPIARSLIMRHSLSPAKTDELDVGVSYAEEKSAVLDYYGLLRALFWLNVALMIGQGISSLIAQTGLTLPSFVGSLLAGILIRNTMPLVARNKRIWNWESIAPGLALISDITLGLFLMMALMGLQLWELQGVVGFVLTALALQIVLAIVYTRWLVFRAMGGDYEAAVISSGFGGIALGSTATAVANMTAVSRQYGPAHRAFVVVPLVCGFFIDLINALVITWMSTAGIG